MAWLLIFDCVFHVQVSSGRIQAPDNCFHVQICTSKLLLLHLPRTRTCFRDFSQTVDRFDLKLGEHVTTIIMHLPYQIRHQWMHGFREKWKMAEDFRGRFLGNRASESAETAWVGYYHPCASPHETGFETDARLWRKCKNG